MYLLICMLCILFYITLISHIYHIHTSQILHLDKILETDALLCILAHVFIHTYIIGTKITFENEGDESPGIIPADIVFTLQTKPHDRFERLDDDLVQTVRA